MGVTKIIKENGLRLGKFGPSDESKGPYSITVRYDHSHMIKTKWFNKNRNNSEQNQEAQQPSDLRFDGLNRKHTV